MVLARRWMALLAPVAVLMVLFSMGAPLARGQEARRAAPGAHPLWYLR